MWNHYVFARKVQHEQISKNELHSKSKSLSLVIFNDSGSDSPVPTINLRLLVRLLEMRNGKNESHEDDKKTNQPVLQNYLQGLCWNLDNYIHGLNTDKTYKCSLTGNIDPDNCDYLKLLPGLLITYINNIINTHKTSTNDPIRHLYKRKNSRYKRHVLTPYNPLLLCKCSNTEWSLMCKKHKLNPTPVRSVKALKHITQDKDIRLYNKLRKVYTCLHKYRPKNTNYASHTKRHRQLSEVPSNKRSRTQLDSLNLLSSDTDTITTSNKFGVKLFIDM